MTYFNVAVHYCMHYTMVFFLITSTIFIIIAPLQNKLNIPEKLILSLIAGTIITATYIVLHQMDLLY